MDGGGAATGGAVVVLGRLGGPHGPHTFGKLEGGDAITETPDSLGGQHEVHLHKLIHHDEGLTFSSQENIILI